MAGGDEPPEESNLVVDSTGRSILPGEQIDVLGVGAGSSDRCYGGGWLSGQ